MKVTKLIREYVEEQVGKAYDSKQNPYTEQAKKDREMIQEFKAQLREQQKKLIDQFTAENEILNSWDNYKPYKTDACTPTFSMAATPAMMNEEKFKKEIAAAKKSKIREIMLQLELGANRAELNAMLASLLEGV